MKAALVSTPVLAASLFLAAPAAAQPTMTVPACETQTALEQYLATEGALVPEECREITVTQVDVETAEPVCVVDFSPATEPGIVDRLADAAFPMQWWVPCAAVAMP